MEVSFAVLTLIVGLGLPQVGASFFERIEKWGGALARKKTIAIVSIGLAAPLIRLAALLWVPIPQPAIHDEFSFLLAADTFASGRLANPTHPMWVHFETFHVDQKPTYMSMYPPAQGMFLALGRVLFGHPWFGVCISVGFMCAAIAWMLYGWLPPSWAFLGGVIAVLRLGITSYWMNSYWGGAPAALGGALVLGSLPRLMRRPRASMAAILAVGLAILANSRPFEGLLVGIPVLVCLVVWFCGKHSIPRVTLLGKVVVPASLLLLITLFSMGYYNWRVFGSPLTMPYQVNRATYAVSPVFIWESPYREPVYRHKVLHDFFVHSELAAFERARTPAGFLDENAKKLLFIFFFYGTPTAAIAAIMFPRVLRDRRIRLLLLIAGFFLIGSLANAFFHGHYFAPVTALLYAVLLQAMRHLRFWKPGGQPVGLFMARAIPAACLLICGLQLFCMPVVTTGGLPRAQMERRLEQTPGRHLVIVRYAAERDPDPMHSFEWVFNAAAIDAAPVVWARDMGKDQNAELIDYFRDRKVWLVEPDAKPLSLQPYPTCCAP
ncbi:MAG TPA: hypothetical protein VG456_15120 [Candidatus Sulfopaludibacter sp.]|jgi:hypothetical protein|nr:hypothetical protein [Candidatus Sulfopaludibacter sp.]